MILDRNIQYKYKTEFIPVTSFNSFGGTANSASSTAALVEAGGDNGYSALTMDADADFARLVMPVPSQWDTNNDIFFRVVYVDTGAGGSVDYDLLFKQSAFGAAISGSVATGTLDTAIPVDTSAGSDALDATAWGKMDGGTLTDDVICIDVSSANGGTTATELVGLEVAYLPKLTGGAQHKLTSDPTDA